MLSVVHPISRKFCEAADLLQRRHQSTWRLMQLAVAAVATRIEPPSSGGALPLQPPSGQPPSFKGFQACSMFPTLLRFPRRTRQVILHTLALFKVHEAERSQAAPWILQVHGTRGQW